MQAITTKFISPTNTRGPRYKASCDAGTVTLAGDGSADSEANHVRAAQALITKLGWWHEDARGDRYGSWYHGGTRAGYVFVCTVEYARVDAPAASTAPAAGEDEDDPSGQACRYCGAVQDCREDCTHKAERYTAPAAAEDDDAAFDAGVKHGMQLAREDRARKA